MTGPIRGDETGQRPENGIMLFDVMIIIGERDRPFQAFDVSSPRIGVFESPLPDQQFSKLHQPVEDVNDRFPARISAG